MQGLTLFGYSLAKAPPWAVSAGIVHAALVVALIVPTFWALARARAGWWWTILLLIPGFGLLFMLFIFWGAVMPRARWSRAWALVWLIPGLNIFVLWVFAFSPWRRPGYIPPPELADPPSAPPAPALRPMARPKPAQAVRAPDPVEEPRTAAPSGPAAAAQAAKTALGPGRPITAPGDGATMVPDAADLRKIGVAGGRTGPAPPPKTIAEDGSTMLPSSAEIQRMAAAASARTVAPDRPRPPAPAPPPVPAAAPPASAEQAPTMVPGRAERTVNPEGAAAAAPVPGRPNTKPQGAAAGPDAPTAPPAAPRGAPSLERAVEAVLQGQPVPAALMPTRWRVIGANELAADIHYTLDEAALKAAENGVLIGRSARADIIVNDESVSRNHARFFWQDGCIQFEDLESMNGSWVDGAKAEPHKPVPLAAEMRIDVGKVGFLIAAG